MIEKIESQALATGEYPAMVIEICNNAGQKLKDVAVMPLWAIKDLIIDDRLL